MRWGKNGQWVLFEKYIIGDDKTDPYMIRWRLFECPLFRIYFHRILRSDNDRHLHDHPFNFISIVLRGGYIEHRKGAFTRAVYPPAIVFRRATDLHRIELWMKVGDPFHKMPAWTLVFAGRRIREWGFQTEDGWVDWKSYHKLEPK